LIFGVPKELASDGGPEFTASLTREFLTHWGVGHCLSSAHHPQSNGRAEVAVKSEKHLLRSIIGPSRSLNSDGLLEAMLQLRNTPDPDCDVSPAQIVFGRPLHDTFSFVNRLDKYSNPNIQQEFGRYNNMNLRWKFWIIGNLALALLNFLKVVQGKFNRALLIFFMI
jgi:transposase InsO family protein